MREKALQIKRRGAENAEKKICENPRNLREKHCKLNAEAQRTQRKKICENPRNLREKNFKLHSIKPIFVSNKYHDQLS